MQPGLTVTGQIVSSKDNFEPMTAVEYTLIMKRRWIERFSPTNRKHGRFIFNG
jgi:hypothetical protein